MWNRLIAAICLGLALAGCNTMAGMGQDIERGGEKLQDSARSVQNRM